MRRFCGISLATSLLLAAVLPIAAPAMAGASSMRWHVIVHPSNLVRTLARTEIERMYRGRTGSWPDGRAIVPLNLPGDDGLRAEFTRDVMRSSLDELATYWNRRYFHGYAPPPVLHSTQAVCAFVAATAGAIGYVDSCADASSVTVVEVDLER